MNSSKRKRHSLYFWIDVFFLSFPLVLIVGTLTYFYVSFSLASKEFYGHMFESVNLEHIFDFQFNFVLETFSSTSAGDDGWLLIALDHSIIWVFSFFGSNSFSSKVLFILQQLFDFLGFNIYTYNDYFNFNALLMYYFTYIICYEFLSFFIQIVLWIPRFFKNKLYDRGLME